MRKALLLLSLLLWPGVSLAKGAMPPALAAITQPHRAGDWILQCDGAQVCRVFGVAKKPGRETRTRALVMISRGIGPTAEYVVRFAFIDDVGFVMPPPDADVRLYARGRPKMPPPLLLSLGPPEGDPAYPLYRTNRDQGLRIVGALRRWPGAVLRSRGVLVSPMPRGDLDRLLRRMDEIQRPISDQLTPAEQSEWLKEYHSVIRPVRRDTTTAMPEEIQFACDQGPRYLISGEAWRLDPDRLLWLAICPEGAHVFVQTRKSGEAAFGKPTSFDLRDQAGQKQQIRDARFNAEGTVLELTLTEKGRWDCGLRSGFGYVGEGRFDMVEHRQLALCRGVPPAYWPLVWQPTSLKVLAPSEAP